MNHTLFPWSAVWGPWACIPRHWGEMHQDSPAIRQMHYNKIIIVQVWLLLTDYIRKIGFEGIQILPLYQVSSAVAFVPPLYGC